MINYSEIFSEENEINFSLYGIANHLPIIILYFIIGFTVSILTVLIDMRGKEFKEDYFDVEQFFLSFMMILFWPILLVLIPVESAVSKITDFLYDQRYVTRFLYKIANIGYKEKEYIFSFDTIDIKAPIAGRVTSIEVEINQVVSIKDHIAVIETENMKIPVKITLNHLTSHEAGTVQSINVAVGEWVETDTIIVTLLGCSHEIYNRLVGE